MAESTHHQITYLSASQAGKEVTVNEALNIVDLMLGCAVLDRTRTSPPGSPVEGDRHIVAAGATDGWAGWSGDIAAWSGGAWLRLTAPVGSLAWVVAERALVVKEAATWTVLVDLP